MAVCKVCGCDIPRGKKFIGEHYKTVPFCSKKCYSQFILSKQQKPKSPPKDKHLVILKDYINDLWNGKVNWPFVMRQIKTMCEDYDLDYKALYLVLHYAVDYENYSVNLSYGLGQFIKFIEPASKFADDIQKNKELAKDIPEEQTIVVKPCKQIRHIKEEDWDD